MKKIISILAILLITGCGDIEQNQNYKNINSRFSISKLRELSQSEINSSKVLCSNLTEKLTTLKTRYMTKFFNYESSIKECEAQETITKNLSLTLENSAATLRFIPSSDSNYAFLRPELKDEYGSFAKFCDVVDSAQRHVEISDNELRHFSIKENNSDYEVEILSSYYNDTINNKKEYKVFKVEKLIYSKSESSSFPKAIVTSRSLETTSGCQKNNTFIKTSVLKSLRD